MRQGLAARLLSSCVTSVTCGEGEDATPAVTKLESTTTAASGREEEEEEEEEEDGNGICVEVQGDPEWICVSSGAGVIPEEDNAMRVSYAGWLLLSAQEAVMSLESVLERGIAGLWWRKQGGGRKGRVAPCPHPLAEIAYSELSVEGKATAVGSFKTVHRGKWKTSGERVAVIFMRPGGDDIAREAGVAARLGRHPHLVRLLGVSVPPSGGGLCVVAELARKGSLDRHLSGMREPAGWGVLLAAAMQANDAMCLFEEHGLLHRDLAARNVLVFSFHPRDRSKVLVKLCDYGLVTDESDVARRERAAVGGKEEEEEEDGPEDLPWRYIPPEVMASRAWSHKSDVWSFGVLMWEMFSLGEIPFAAEDDDRQVASLVSAGVVLERPASCPPALYAVMRRCWAARPDARPSFQELKLLLMDAFAASAAPSLHGYVLCECSPASDGAAQCGLCGGASDGAMAMLRNVV